MTEVAASRSVLMVDDDAFLASLYSAKFSQKGFVTHVCLSAEEALGILESGFVPEVMLLDIDMPQIDGLMLLRSIREKNLAPNAQVIMFTNEDTPAERAAAHELGASHYIIKASMIPSEVVDMITGFVSRT